jgi:branched-chain amino acid transport system substrate-binding protein
MKRSLLGLAAISVLLIAACGDDDDDSGGGATTVAASGTPTTAAATPTTAAATPTTAAAATTTAASATPTTAGGASTTAASGTPTTAATGGGASNIQKPGECGMGTGEKATGEPIKIGAMATKAPVADFTWITGMTKAYFDCVNDNGGINGRPIQYIAEEEQIDPQQIASLARKLIEQDQVLGIVGSTSLIECSVNKDYYAQQNFYLIIAGVAQDCFTSPNFSAVNMGPYYSSLGGAQAALRAGAEGKMVVASPNQPGFDLINSGVVEYAEDNGLEGVSILEDAPFADPAAFAQRLVQEAGDGGGVVLDYTGPNVVPLLQSIEQQGLVDSVVWASSTPPNDPSVAQALGAAWNGKFLINAEFNVLDSGQPDQNHMNEVREQYAPDINSSSFAQMGYLAGRVATDALLGIQGDITKESVNEAFRSIKNFTSDIWCKPWYFDSTVGSNVSNNVDITVSPQDGNMVQVEDCFPIAELDSNPLAEIRAKEQELGLNVG